MLDFLRGSKALVKEDISANTKNGVAELLQRLRDSHKKVFIRFEGENVTYACNIGAFNLSHHVIVVSDLCSDIPPATLQKGKAVSVIVREQGRGIDVECSYIEPLVENQTGALQLKLPRDLGAPSGDELHSLFG